MNNASAGPATLVSQTLAVQNDSVFETMSRSVHDEKVNLVEEHVAKDLKKKNTAEGERKRHVIYMTSKSRTSSYATLESSLTV